MKKTNTKPKILLETSIQIKRQIDDDIKKIIDEFYRNNRLYSSNFIKYEFKAGFIRNFINFYFLVKVWKDPSIALIKLSQSFKPRELKNGLILQGLLQRLNNKIDTKNTKKYLAQIESIISSIVENFETNLISLVGDFSSNEIVRYELFDSSSYQGFITLLNNEKGIIPLDKFWNKHQNELELLIKDSTIYKKKHQFIYDGLCEIKNDTSNAKMPSVCKKIGDAVIAVDSPSSFTILTLDSSFDKLCPIINKKHRKLTNAQPIQNNN